MTPSFSLCVDLDAGRPTDLTALSSSSSSDSQIHPGTSPYSCDYSCVAFPRLSWKVNCEFWMPGVKVRSKKTQTNNKVRPDTQGYDSAVPFLLAMKSSSNTFSSKASMATKITSVRDGQLHYTFSAT